MKATVQGAGIAVPLAGATPGSSLTVEAVGYDSQTFPITGNATVDGRVALRRQQAEISFRLQDGTTDYVSAIFQPIKALPGEEAFVRVDPDQHNLTLTAGTQDVLPTGLYQVTLLGPPSNPAIQPRVLTTRFPVTKPQSVLPIPPSLAGRYTFDFSFKITMDHPATKVHRTMVIDPGLRTGHVDDDYESTPPARDTRITDLTLDLHGVLRGIIRFSLRTDENESYDEQFELSYTDDQFVVVGGGWEIQSTDPEVIKTMQARLPGYQLHLIRPAPQPVTKD